MYRSEQRIGRIYGYFTFLAVFVSCLGLFGLAAFIAERRTKEIGIRKVLGASVPKIVGLLIKEFVVLVTLSNMIAWPIAYYAMHKWLANFAYHADLALVIFVFSGILALTIAILTVGYQAFCAARVNPVEALKYE